MRKLLGQKSSAENLSPLVGISSRQSVTLAHYAHVLFCLSDLLASHLTGKNHGLEL